MDETTNPEPRRQVAASEAITSELVAPVFAPPVVAPPVAAAAELVVPDAGAQVANPSEEAAPVTNPTPPAAVPEPVSPVVVASPPAVASELLGPAAVAPLANVHVVAEVVPVPPSAPTRRRQAAVDLISVWLGNLVVSLLTAAFVVVFLYQPVKVEGTSMLPGLEDQERIFVNRFVYRLEPISRGDVIVFRYPKDTSKSYIKRVIGVAGDRIHIVDGLVYVNGELLSEDYVPVQYADWRSVPELTVPQGSYFMMGDHRNMSSDSRDFGPVEQKFVVGKAVFGYWPFEKMGKVK